jgi:hypothetical protein
MPKIQADISVSQATFSAVLCVWFSSTARTVAALLLRFLDHTHPAGLFWTSDQLLTKAARYLHNTQTQETTIHAISEIRTRNSSHEAVADVRLRPQSHLDLNSFTKFKPEVRLKACSVPLRVYLCVLHKNVVTNDVHFVSFRLFMSLFYCVTVLGLFL